MAYSYPGNGEYSVHRFIEVIPVLGSWETKGGALSCPETIEESNKKNKDSSSFLASSQPMKSHELFCLL